MGCLIHFLDNYFYSEYQDNWDDQLFREHIFNYINEETVMLDLGAGAGIINAMNFYDNVKMVCGIDMDPRVVDNNMLHEGRIANAESIPYDNHTFDIVISDNVMEHLEYPEKVFNEVNRVLKDDGLFLFKTPNKYHYMPFISRSTPHIFHQYINKIRGRKVADTFPTIYRANSKKAILEFASSSNFKIETIQLVEGRPEYLRINIFTYFFGICYEKLVNSNKWFSQFRILLIGILRKST